MATKKMNLNNLVKLENNTFTKTKVVCGDYEVNVDKVFRDTDIVNSIKETLEKSTYCNENNITFDAEVYGIALMLKYFTDIDFPAEYEKQIQVVSILMDLGYLNTIMESFSESEIKRYSEKVVEFSQNLTKQLEEILAKSEAEKESETVESDTNE